MTPADAPVPGGTPSGLVGAGSLLATGGVRRHLDAVVLSGSRLEHYRRALTRPDRPWIRCGTVSERAGGPGRLERHGRRLVAVVDEPAGERRYVLGPTGWAPDAIRPRDAAAMPPPPPPDEFVAESGQEVRGLSLARAGGREYALVDEAGSLFGYERLPNGEWVRASCLRLAPNEPFTVAATESVKLAQVTGDLDATPTPWGQRAPTLSGSRATAGVRGTDLGVRVEHAGRSFLLFGDTHWSGRPWLATRDAIAEVVPEGPVAAGLLPAGLPGVRFHGSPLKLVGRAAGRVTMREYDVPLDAFSAGGRLYAFFSSNHFTGPRVMGRSVLARAADPELRIDPAARWRPLVFEVLGGFSERHFVNVSVQVRPASAVPGCGSVGDVLLVWGTGAYRASEPRLALLDPALATRAARRGARPFRVRYWAGDGWSDTEAHARPLFGPEALGELSVRWVAGVGRYLMLTASAPEDPIGPSVVLRSAALPQGPWSRRVRLLDWVATGMSLDPHTRFIKASRDDDPVGDRIFRSQARGTGAAYAPYLFDAVVDGHELVLRYTLSTWNPYQVVLMQHRLPLADLP